MKWKKNQFLFEHILQYFLIFVFIFMSYLKLSSAPEAVLAFEHLGMEPLGRFTIGVLEFNIVLLLLTKKFSPYGLILSFGILSGALIAHTTVLGWKNSLGSYNILIFFSSFIATLFMMFFRRRRLPLIGKSLST